MNIGDLGEFGLIDTIAGVIGKVSRDNLILGMGDDASAWSPGGSIQLGTTDVLVQDVHFTLDTAAWRDLGWKSLAINISDIAAMGGSPGYALVSLGLPPDTEVDDVVELCHGLVEVAAEFNVAVCGGNVSSAPVVFISISLIGEASGSILTRSAASPGDKIAVTGCLGQAAAGLRMLQSKLEFNPETATFLRRAHLNPYPRVAEGLILAQNGVKAAIDLSDGLLGDLTHVCKASSVGAKVRIKDLPVHPLVKTAFADESINLALSGGEDYELLYTARDDVMDRIKDLMPGPITVIGEIVKDDPGKVTLVDEQGKAVDRAERGWDHFNR
jgi:thiamine-monophosphate kinase